ncbi:hypothetical protein K7432_008643 [Basidiobolus ranarum]|uniref:Uncharacterized protein n=1 Tax=Basidiobolus ranarum TaxID=34480 RepID=A0ABR2VYB2_9FUNG
MEVDEPQAQNAVSNGTETESVPITSEAQEHIEPPKDTNSIPSSETTDSVIIAPSSVSTQATNIEDAKSIEPTQQNVDDSQKNESTDVTSDSNGVESNPTPKKDTLDGQHASHDEA